MWRSALPRAGMAVHPTPGGLTIDPLERASQVKKGGGGGRGRLDAGLRAGPAARAVADRATAPKQKVGDKARPPRSPHPLRTDRPPHQPPPRPPQAPPPP